MGSGGEGAVGGYQDIFAKGDAVAGIDDATGVDDALFAYDQIAVPPAGFILTKESTTTPASMTIFVPFTESSISARGEMQASGEINNMKYSLSVVQYAVPYHLHCESASAHPA